MNKRSLSVWSTLGCRILGFAFATMLTINVNAQEDHSNRAVAKIVKEQTLAEPGKSMWVAVQFKIEQGWHLYWPGHNDTGFAPEFKVSLPDGWTLGKARWGAPQRHVSSGNIVDYTYENDMMVLFPLEVPQNVAVGEVVELAMDLSWLVCNETCVSEKQSVQAQIRVGVPGGSKPVATQVENFTKARALIPVVLEDAPGRPDITCEGTSLKITSKGATRVEFMPSKDGVSLTNAFEEGAIDGETLVASLDATAEGDHVVSGIVAVYHGEKRETYWLERPLGTRSGASGQDPIRHDAE